MLQVHAKAQRREGTQRRGMRRCAAGEGKVGRFCCPALPGPLVSASVARCGPTALLSLVTQPVRVRLRGNRERLVIVGTCVMGRCGGPIPGESCAFQHTSILVRPHQLSRWGGTLHACCPSGSAHLVEPPGTAPGSAAPMTRNILSP